MRSTDVSLSATIIVALVLAPDPSLAPVEHSRVTRTLQFYALGKEMSRTERQQLLGGATRDLSSYALDRKSVVWGTCVSVRVDIGGRRSNKKKTKYKKLNIQQRKH